MSRASQQPTPDGRCPRCGYTVMWVETAHTTNSFTIDPDGTWKISSASQEVDLESGEFVEVACYACGWEFDPPEQEKVTWVP